MTSCRMCKRESAPASLLCTYHLGAKRNLESGYKKWSEAYGQIAWEDYLRKIKENSETGQWVKEVAELLLAKEAVE
ncbi:MAG TPA: hypothetical protein VLY65_00735 [Nitrososphaerales archaeon]|nr:hypothetical protein [Nitrososphaerales archaeon]